MREIAAVPDEHGLELKPRDERQRCAMPNFRQPSRPLQRANDGRRELVVVLKDVRALECYALQRAEFVDRRPTFQINRVDEGLDDRSGSR